MFSLGRAGMQSRDLAFSVHIDGDLGQAGATLVPIIAGGPGF
jgi:hypothetical protein